MSAAVALMLEGMPFRAVLDPPEPVRPLRTRHEQPPARPPRGRTAGGIASSPSRRRGRRFRELAAVMWTLPGQYADRLPARTLRRIAEATTAVNGNEPSRRRSPPGGCLDVAGGAGRRRRTRQPRHGRRCAGPARRLPPGPAAVRRSPPIRGQGSERDPAVARIPLVPDAPLPGLPQRAW